MLIESPAPFRRGYTAITELDGKHKEMLVGFGVLRLDEGDDFSEGAAREERAFLLLSGRAELFWSTAGGTVSAVRTVSRDSVVEEGPAVLHVPYDAAVKIRSLRNDTEFCIIRRVNDTTFSPRFLAGPDIDRVVLASGRAAEETKRELRIAADDESAPFSEMVFGEVLNYPGKWSSYPPHHHPHPEIYHYRFEPENGFGYAEEGGEVYRVTSGDTLLVAPHKVHPQTAAPGYAMVYVWAMPHLQEERFGKDSRKFVPEYSWVLD